MSLPRNKTNALDHQPQNVYQALGFFLAKEKEYLYGKQAIVVENISEEVTMLSEYKMQWDNKKLEKEIESANDKMKYILTCLFHLAIEHQQLNIVKNIYAYSIHIMHSLNPFSPHQYTALHTLCLNENENVMLADFLLKAGCLVSVTEKEKKLTPVELAEAKQLKKYATLFSQYASVYGNPKSPVDSTPKSTPR